MAPLATYGDRGVVEALAKSLDASSAGLDRLVVSTVSQEQAMLAGISVPGELYGEVSRYVGRPTQSQLGPLNAKLKAANLAPVARLSREEFDKRRR